MHFIMLPEKLDRVLPMSKSNSLPYKENQKFTFSKKFNFSKGVGSHCPQNSGYALCALSRLETHSPYLFIDA
jgi:hypothetical protein